MLLCLIVFAALLAGSLTLTWKLYGPLLVIGCVLLLAFAPTAHADVRLSLDGFYYAHPHHWYTNDSSREGRALHDIEHDAPSTREEDRAIHVLAPDVHEDESQVSDWDDLPSEHAAHKLRERCKGYRLLYLMRHGLSTPSSLRGEHGCRKWTDDAMYHDEKREPMFPTLRGMLDEELSHA